MPIAPITDAESVRRICLDVRDHVEALGPPEKVYPQRGRGFGLFAGLGGLVTGVAMAVSAVLVFNGDEAISFGGLGLGVAAMSAYLILKVLRRRYLVLAPEGFLDVRGARVRSYRWDRVEAIVFAGAPVTWVRADAPALDVVIRFRGLDPLALDGKGIDGQGLYALDDFLLEARRRCPGVPVEVAQ